MEPICEPEPNTYVFSLRPRFPHLNEQFVAARAVDWKPHDVKFNQDLAQFRALPPATQRMIKRVMALFAQADSLIASNLNANFLQEVRCQAAQSFFIFQAAIEAVHAEVYAMMLEVYIADEAERDELLHAVAHYPVIADKQAWVLRWCDASAASLAERLVAFAAVECIFFSPSFACFSFFKSLGILPGLCFANSYIARDEGMHVRFACSLYGELRTKLPEERVHAIVSEAVEIELRFADFLLLGDEGETIVAQLPAADMREYVKVCANVLCGMLGVDGLYPDAKNQLAFMDQMTAPVRVNFFERDTEVYTVSNALPTGGDDELLC